MIDSGAVVKCRGEITAHIIGGPPGQIFKQTCRIFAFGIEKSILVWVGMSVPKRRPRGPDLPNAFSSFSLTKPKFPLPTVYIWEPELCWQLLA